MAAACRGSRRSGRRALHPAPGTGVHRGSAGHRSSSLCDWRGLRMADGAAKRPAAVDVDPVRGRTGGLVRGGPLEVAARRVGAMRRSRRRWAARPDGVERDRVSRRCPGPNRSPGLELEGAARREAQGLRVGSREASGAGRPHPSGRVAGPRSGAVARGTPCRLGIAAWCRAGVRTGPPRRLELRPGDRRPRTDRIGGDRRRAGRTAAGAGDGVAFAGLHGVAGPPDPASTVGGA